MMFPALIISACAGYWLGRWRAMILTKSRQKMRHEWAAFGQGGSVHAAASFRHDDRGGYAYKPGQTLPEASPGRIYLHSPP